MQNVIVKGWWKPQIVVYPLQMHIIWSPCRYCNKVVKAQGTFPQQSLFEIFPEVDLNVISTSFDTI